MKIFLFLCFALCGASMAAAGVETAPTVSKAASDASSRSGPAPVYVAKAAGGPTLRCWQYGNLIFEEPISSVPPSMTGSLYVFESRTGAAPVQLLDIKSAVCLVSDRDSSTVVKPVNVLK